MHPADHLNDLAAPSLPDAPCADEWELFDRAVGGYNPDDVACARETALQLCAACPVLAACRAWFTSLPVRDRPIGVVAGRLVTKRSARTPWSLSCCPHVLSAASSSCAAPWLSNTARSAAAYLSMASM